MIFLKYDYYALVKRIQHFTIQRTTIVLCELLDSLDHFIELARLAHAQRHTDCFGFFEVGRPLFTSNLISMWHSRGLAVRNST